MSIETTLGTVDLDALPRPVLRQPTGIPRQLNPLEIELAQKVEAGGTLEQGEETGLISLASASKAVLILLPGVGEKTAQKIIDARPFGSFEDLEAADVDFPGDAKRYVSF